MREDLAVARTLVTLAIYDDPALFREIAALLLNPMLANAVIQALAEALAATYSNPEDWQQHLAEADKAAEGE